MINLIDIACRGYLTAEAQHWKRMFKWAAGGKPDKDDDAYDLQAHRIWFWGVNRWGAEKWPRREYEIRTKEYDEIFRREMQNDQVATQQNPGTKVSGYHQPSKSKTARS
jgi:hypothetical protein